MPKNKQYEYDYEWDGNAKPQAGVNIAKKNPFKAPAWKSPGASKPPKCQSHTPVQEAATPKRHELEAKFPWQKPNWATVDKSPKKQQHAQVIKSSIPKPMLKETPNSPLKSKTGSSNTPSGDADADSEVQALERKIAEAKRRKEELMKQKEEEAERTKHTVEETKLERARRLAKEREEQRWRDTLKERNERDKKKRLEAASKLAAPVSDKAWQKPVEKVSEPKRQYENDPYGQEQQQLPSSGTEEECGTHEVEQGVATLQTNQEALGAYNNTNQPTHNYNDYQTPIKQYDDDSSEYEEEIIEEVAEEEDEVDPAALRAAELQRQIDALERELQQV